MKRIILVTGGCRSGKSAFAESLALSLSPAPVYLATARVQDDEMRARVEKHRERRGPQWTNIEEDKGLAAHDFAGRVVLLDCLTLLCSNYLFDADGDSDSALSSLTDELQHLFAQDATFIAVTNEVGLGGVSANPLQRKFADMQGLLNQFVASLADEVHLVVSGIPVKIK